MFDNDDQRMTMWGCDYAPYMIPASQGGKGPENATEILGIECNHHSGITVHPIVEGEAVFDTVYGLIRNVWHKAKSVNDINVTDDNHTWKNVATDKPGHFSKVVLYKNEKSPLFINLLGAPRWSYDDGPGAKWFDQEYRIATVGTIAAEIANNQRRYAEYLEAYAKKNIMTITGRKSALRYRDFASDCLRLNRVILRRHPQLAYLTEGDEDAFNSFLIADNRRLRAIYLERASKQHDNHRGIMAAARLREWAGSHLRRNRTLVTTYPHLAHLVPDEELVAA